MTTGAMDRKAMWIAAFATLLGAALLWLYMRRFEQEAGGGPRTPVLVLARDARRGTAIDASLLTQRAQPEAYLESRHIAARDADDVVGARLGVDARAGEALLWTDLASLREPARQLSGLIPEGMRAIVIDLRGGLDELLNAGDRVDVLLVGRPGADPERGEVPALVAQSLLVLAVGDDLGGPRARRAARDVHGVSLAVTQEQAARLSDAERRGTLRLLLRNAADLEVSATLPAPPEEPR
jgi:pilus assembly protein CpaB